MRCKILHESAGRMRIHVMKRKMSPGEADVLEYYLKSRDFVSDVRVYDRTGDAVIRYTDRAKLVKELSTFSFEKEEVHELVPETTGRQMNHEYEEKMVFMILGRTIRRLIMPAWFRHGFSAVRSLHHVRLALRSIGGGKMDVSVLDAAAVLASLMRQDFDTAGSVMFLLKVGELLEEWTYRKSVDDLARSLSLKVDRAWVEKPEGNVLLPVREVEVGDTVHVGTSGIIPLDGSVTSGEAMVNQAAMTGESIPVHKEPGGYVYAGTVVEEGELSLCVARKTGRGKYDQIVRMIEDSEKLKSDTETKAYHMADSLVPYSFLGAGLTYLLTRNVQRALSFLMVDFSCALKLSMPLSMLSAMKEAGERGITVKGAKFLEAAAQADTIVFDKTGTLTKATPTVVKVLPFGDMTEDEALRIAACLEEHYPHSMANAVVKEAKRRGLIHEEMHSEVSYVVAHGIASHIDGKKALIGSHHFIFEDEGCRLAKGEEAKLEALPKEYSRLYLAIDGKVCAAICIFDPLREEAGEVIRRLHEAGISKVCMMTGDNEVTARAIAEGLELDDYRAGVLPEEKAQFVDAQHEAGRKVIMVGDGVNDTPALSAADVGIAVSDGAAIAREVADITVSEDSLYPILTIRELSDALVDRIHRNYRVIIGFNMGLIALGVLGVLPPATSALLHNGSTIVIGLESLTKLLPDNEKHMKKRQK